MDGNAVACLSEGIGYRAKSATRSPMTVGRVLDRPSVAGMAELVDAPDSKSGVRKDVRVRVPFPVPKRALS